MRRRPPGSRARRGSGGLAGRVGSPWAQRSPHPTIVRRQMAEAAIVVHGGAGRVPTDPDRLERMRSGAAAGVEAGYAVLAGGGGALDAVEAAVVALEDDPEFNAGRGAALTEDGRVELDASIMGGTSHAAGAVACVAGVRNPIRAARAIL